MKYVLFFVLALFTGCTSLTKPETYNQKLLYVTAVAEATAKSAQDLYERNAISKEKAIKIVEQLEIVDFTLSNSRISYGTGDTKTALDYLSKANSILIQIEKQLKESQNAKQSTGPGTKSNYRFSGTNEFWSLSSYGV